jgi:phosphoglucosamine mutase
LTKSKSSSEEKRNIGHEVTGGKILLPLYRPSLSAAEGSIGKLKILVDCSNGAASRTVSDIFGRFPLELELIKDHPDGVNINDGCGSTHPELLQRLVVAGDFDLGLAFDGDADRCIAVDENGRVVDGDKIMAICGVAMKSKGKLAKKLHIGNRHVQYGLPHFTAARGFNLECTTSATGTYWKRSSRALKLGGAIRHLIFLDIRPQGDGQLAAVNS